MLYTPFLILPHYTQLHALLQVEFYKSGHTNIIMKKQSKNNFNNDLCKKLQNIFNDPQDPSGSYTGTCTMGDCFPEQDADDL